MSVTIPHRQSQTGMISIIVTMVMMVVISLIVLGFAQVSRRDERKALDQQLSTQAYLAAETGINDAYTAIRSALAANIPVEEKDTCPPPTDPSSIYAGQSNYLDPPTNSISYSCLLVSTKLDNLVQTVAADGSGVTLPLHPADPALAKIGRINITWSAPNPVTSVSSCATNVPPVVSGPLPPAGSWQCPYSLLRVELVPTDPGALNRTDLINNQQVTFMYPTQSAAGTVNYNATKGTTVGMRCTASSCTAAITNVPSGFTNYQLRLSSVYQTGGIITIGAATAGGAPVQLKDAQVAIDSTGKAQDVLRRIQARMSLTGPNQAPMFALESGSSICKRFGIDSGITISGVVGQDSNNPYCNMVVTNPPPTSTPQPPTPVPTQPPGKCIIGNDIVLALDSSGSMYDANLGNAPRITVLKQTMTKFIQNSDVGPNLDNNLESIFNFAGAGNESEKIALTSNVPQLVSVVNGLQRLSGTAYIPVLNLIKQNGWPAGVHRPLARKILVFVTDGLNTAETDQQSIAAADALKSKGVIIYTIAISNNSVFFGRLKAMATSPSYFAQVNNQQELDAIINQINADVACKNPALGG